MAQRRVRLTFPDSLIREPIIYQMGHEFDVVTNIRMADIGSAVGWVLIELHGEDSEIDRSLEWAESKGLRVDPVAGDVVEG